MPIVTTELHYDSAFQLLVATMLSAQCTDARINRVTPALFGAFPDAASMSAADESDVVELIKSVSYPNAKARHLCQMAQQLVERHDGVVPDSGEALEALAGVGRKTANVVLAVWFKQARIPVDTHVFRVSRRLGLVSGAADSPAKVEQELYRYVPRELSANAHHWLLLHGRYICRSRKARCGDCPFDVFCPSAYKV